MRTCKFRPIYKHGFPILQTNVHACKLLSYTNDGYGGAAGTSPEAYASADAAIAAWAVRCGILTANPVDFRPFAKMNDVDSEEYKVRRM